MADTLNPDDLRNEIRITITNQLSTALAELPGRWPVGRRRFLFFSHRKRVAESLTEAIWPLVVDAALGMAQAAIDDAPSPSARWLDGFRRVHQAIHRVEVDGG